MTTDRVRATVAVTGMNATDNPAPGVGIVRALRHEPAFAGKVIGLGYDALDPGFYAMGLLDGGAILPYPSAGREATLDRLRSLRETHGIDVLIPSLDSELRAISSLEHTLAACGIHTFVPSIDALERVSKPRLPELQKCGPIHVPDSCAVTAADELAARCADIGFPLLVKGPFYGAELVHTVAAAAAAFHRFAATWGVPVILQRFVAGGEYNVAAVGDGTGRTVGAVAMHKLVLTDKGKGWSGVTISKGELVTVTEAIIDATRWRGPLEVEVLRETKTGRLYVIEVNPRFPAWIYLSAAAGQNLPYYVTRMALGLDIAHPVPAYRVGTMFVRISLDQIADMSTYEQLASHGALANREPSGPRAFPTATSIRSLP